MTRDGVTGTICGIDEAGRGALAGPIVLAAVVLPERFDFADGSAGLVVRDSKLLSARQRSLLFDAIVRHSLRIETCAIGAREIDARGINWANTAGFARLIKRIDAGRYVVDGRWSIPPVRGKTDRVTCVIRADQTVPAVLAAGVVAKVTRDRIMQRLHDRYPAYGWDTNTGHGTERHITAIRESGVTGHHRSLFVATALSGGRKERARLSSTHSSVVSR